MTLTTTSHPTSEASHRTPAVSDTDTYGIAHYLANGVLTGTITIEEGADALAEWVDHDDEVLARIANRMPSGDSARYLLPRRYRTSRRIVQRRMTTCRDA